MIHNALIDLLLDNSDQDTEEVTKCLEEAGIDYISSGKKLLDWIHARKADLLIKNGEKLKEKFDNIVIDNSGGEKGNFKIAARNLDNLSGEEKALITRQLHILKRLEEE